MLASGMPSASASARWAASKLVTPIAPISPSSRSRVISCRASSQAGCSKLHQWNCRRSTCSTPSRSSRSWTPGAHDLRRHRPGLRAPFGHGDRPPSPRIAREQPAGDQLGAAVVVGHVEGVEAVRGIGLRAHRRPLGVERRAVLLDVGDLPEAADQPARSQARREGRCGQACPAFGDLAGAATVGAGRWREIACAPRRGCRAAAGAGWRRARRRSARSAAPPRAPAGRAERARRSRWPRRAQTPQTTTAPRIAPRLLPEPPTISIAQTWKVSIGW